LKTCLSNHYLKVEIQHKGAELVSLHSKKENREYIWEGDPQHWGKHSPILFPIVGTLKDNSYNHNGKTYKLSRHGFARDMEFELIHETKIEAVFSLRSNEETLKLYPFNFELQLIYVLHDSELRVTCKVVNNDLQNMYYSIGGHPAFCIPEVFSNYSLKFNDNKNLISYQLENDLLSDKTTVITLKNGELPLSYSLFENDALIFKQLKSRQIQLLENNIPILNFKFNDFPNFGIWTKVKAPFICLEPWAGYSDLLEATGNLTEKEGIRMLESKAVKEYSFGIEIL